MNIKIAAEDLESFLETLAEKVAAKIKAGAKTVESEVKEVAKPATKPKTTTVKKPTKPEEKPEEGTEDAADQVEVTMEDARAKLREFRDKHGMAETTKVIGKYATKFSEVKPEDYAALISDLEAADKPAEEDDPFA
jgi:hypothetical protein